MRHLAINSVDRLSSQLGICIGIKRLYPSLRLREHSREIRRNGVVVIDRLLDYQEILSRVLIPLNTLLSISVGDVSDGLLKPYFLFFDTDRDRKERGEDGVHAVHITRARVGNAWEQGL